MANPQRISTFLRPSEGVLPPQHDALERSRIAEVRLKQPFGPSTLTEDHDALVDRTEAQSHQAFRSTPRARPRRSEEEDVRGRFDERQLGLEPRARQHFGLKRRVKRSRERDGVRALDRLERAARPPPQAPDHQHQHRAPGLIL